MIYPVKKILEVNQTLKIPYKNNIREYYPDNKGHKKNPASDHFLLQTDLVIYFYFFEKWVIYVIDAMFWQHNKYFFFLNV